MREKRDAREKREKLRVVQPIPVPGLVSRFSPFPLVS